jgi:short subunit dehydrogenase-like uncharacterized protein
MATAQHYSLVGLQLLMILPPGRWLLSKVLNKPGEGADREVSASYFAKFKAIATSESGRRVTARVDLMNSVYYFTGLFVAEAALEIVKGSGGRAVREGGVMTSACLEDGYVDRLEKAGLKLVCQELPEIAKL